MAFTPRQGTASRVLKIKETVWGGDPGSPVKVLSPLMAEAGFGVTQPRNPAVIYDGRRTSKGSFKGMLAAAGADQMSLHFAFVGHDLICHLGSSGYTRVGSLHRWSGIGTPISYQRQEEFQEAPVLYHRQRGIVSTLMQFTQQMSGQAGYTITALGNGDEVFTDVGGSVLDYQTASPGEAFKAYNYFDGALLLNGTSLLSVVNFGLGIDNKVTRKDAAFSAGKAAALNYGIPSVEGDLGRVFTVEDGDTYYNLAINDTICSLECFWANAPLSANPTAYLRVVIPAMLISRTSAKAGGDNSKDQTQHYIAQVAAAGYPAAAVSSLAGPYPFVAGVSDTLKFFIDGGGASVGIVGAPPNSTTDAVVALLNAVGGFTAVATASNFLGRLKVSSKSTVAAVSKVAADTVVALTGATVAGFAATVFSGYAADMLYVELQNNIVADY